MNFQAFNIEQETNTDPFTDEKTKNILLPCNFEETKWIRPEDYLRNIILNKEIKISFPNKNLMKTRNSAKDFYQKYELPNRKLLEEMNQNQNQNQNQNNNHNDQFNDINFKSNPTINESISAMGENVDLINKKRYAFRDLITILDKRIDMKIVNFKLRDETEEEMQLRKEMEKRF